MAIKAEGHPLIGANYPPLPEEVERMGGWKIKSPYVVNQVVYNGQESLLLGRLLKRDSQGKGSYKVVDVLPLPPVNRETEQLLAGLFCTVNGKEDLNMIVVMKSNDNTPYLAKARKAWRVEGEEFKEVNVTSYRFRCENLSYGL